jgi:hypothetical protein
MGVADWWNKTLIRSELRPRVGQAIDRLPLNGASKASIKYGADNAIAKTVDKSYEAGRRAVGFTGSGRCENNHKMSTRDRNCGKCGALAVPATVRLCPEGHRAGKKDNFCTKCGEPVADRDPSRMDPGTLE